MPHAFSRRLAGGPLLCDGAMGTVLYARGVSPDACVGLLPLHSFRHAEFLHNEVPGTTVPDPVRARMREAGDRALAAGIELAQSLVHEARRRYAGAYLMPSFGRFEVVAEVLDALH